jgi:putative protease
MGVAEVAIDARQRPARYTQEMTRVYRKAVDYTNAGQIRARDPFLSARKEEVRNFSLGGITAGHFLRGLRE